MPFHILREHFFFLTIYYYRGLSLVSSCPQAGERFDKVAQECSEDKAKGTLLACWFIGTSCSRQFFS